MRSTLDERTRQKLDGLKRLGLRRELPDVTGGDGRRIVVDGEEYLNFSSNDYLGLAHDQEVVQAAQSALEQFGAGAGGSRLICGNHPLYRRLEKELADWKGREAGLVFGSGYLTSLGVIRGILSGRDHVIHDALSHRCLLEGVTLSGATSSSYEHNDLADLRDKLDSVPEDAGDVLVVTEGVFSMDGDRAPLQSIREMTREQGAWMMVDEAHSAGVWGPEGRGLTAELEDSVEVSMGTLSKAFGGYGGYVAGSRTLIDFLVNRATSLIYSTGLPPSVVAGNLAALNLIRRRPERRERLRNHVIRVTDRMASRGLPLPDPPSQVIPLLTGDSETTLEAGERFQAEGLYAVPIRYPTVPRHLGRLRISLRSDHTEEDIDRLMDAVEELDREGLLKHEGPWRSTPS